MIEVKANLSFDSFRQGQRYQVDPGDQRIVAQIAGGYFTITKVLEEKGAANTLDSDGFGPGFGGDLVSRMESPEKKKKPRKVAADGTGSDLRFEGESVRPQSDTAFGAKDS